MFNVLATFAEFEADLIRMRTREGMAVAKARGQSARGQSRRCSRPNDWDTAETSWDFVMNPLVSIV